MSEELPEYHTDTDDLPIATETEVETMVRNLKARRPLDESAEAMEMLGKGYPAQVFRPGVHIADELNARGWTQKDLAQRIHRHPSAINSIVRGRTGISPRLAIELSGALGISAEFWLNLDSAYRLYRCRQRKTQHERFIAEHIKGMV
jgi:addiction module HigA family antidote